LTFRLIHLKTQRKQDHARLQDLHYVFDPVGNITSIRDHAQETIYFHNHVVSSRNDYVYDAIYRLISADGREHAGAPDHPQTTWNDGPRMHKPLPSDGQAMHRYREAYDYDGVGNILEILHAAADGNWSRIYSYDETQPRPRNNRLTSSRVGQDEERYHYDHAGNMTRMPHLAHMEWDFKDQLHATRERVVNRGCGEPTYYVYDAAGQRVRKVTESATGSRRHERIYVAGFEVYREYDSVNAVTLERQTLQVMDDKQRIALVETRTRGDDESPAQLVRYQHGNHLGSACLELDKQAVVISYEEYTPYGSTSYQAMNQSIRAAAKRYRYTGKERDEETGFNYHGARYCIPWLGKWLNPDPLGRVDGANLYVYASNNPLKYTDPTGKECDPTKQSCVDPTPAKSHEQSSRAAAATFSRADAATSSSKGATASGAGSSLITNHPPGFTLEVPNNFDNAKIRAYKQRITDPMDRGVGIRSRPPGQRSATADIRAANQAVRDAYNDALPAGQRALRGVRDIDHTVELQNIIRGNRAPGANVARPQDLRPQSASLNRSQGATNRAVVARQVANGAPVDTPAGGVARTSEMGRLSNSQGFRTTMRYGGYALTAAGTVYSAYQFHQDISQGNWGSAALSGTGFAGGALVLGGTAVGSGTLVSAGVVVGAPAAVVGAGLAGVGAGMYINEHTKIQDTAADAGTWMEGKTSSVLGKEGAVYAGATTAALTAIATSPYYAGQAAVGALGDAGSWLGDKVYDWLN
jgi:RHS repeat-associated protein